MKLGERPIIKDLAIEYVKSLSDLNQTEKMDLIYINTVGKKPLGLDMTKKLNRILYAQKFSKQIADTNKFLKNKKKGFKWPWKWKKVFKKSLKDRKNILVFFLNIKGEIEPPKLYPIYSSNMVIIRNRPYEVDPRSFWRLGKFTCQIIKGIDRRPVSNLDYREIKKRGDGTDSDEFLIKAAMQAVVGGIKKKPMDKKVLIIVGIIALAAMGYFMTQ